MNSSQNDFLWSLLENPANDASSCVDNLHRLVNDFPQSGILQALLAHASEEKNLRRASAYFSPRALFKLVNAPSTFTGVPDERMVIQPGISINGSYPHSERPTYNESYHGNAREDLVADKAAPAIEPGDELNNHHEQDELVADPNAAQYVPHAKGEEHQDIPPVASDTQVTEIDQPVENASEAAHEEVPHQFDIPVEQPLSGITQEETVHEAAASTEEHIPETTYEETVHEVAAPTEEHISETILEGIVHETAVPTEADLSEAVPVEVANEVAATVEEHPTEAVYEEAVSEHEAPAEEHLTKATDEDLAHKVAAHNQFSDETAPQEEDAHHVGFEATPDVNVETAEHGQSEAPEVEPQQAIELDTDKEEPTPLIELPEEEPALITAEIPVQEETGTEPEGALGDDEDEVYDEIVGIEDITLDQPGGQYFSFDQEFGAHVDEAEQEQTASDIAAGHIPGEAEQQDVSKYHDEKMPYSFMWWLDKTRKEHAQTYQPYVKPATTTNKKAKRITDELQQQYFENIFHITSVEDLDKSTPSPSPAAAADFKRKEQQIIERFIKEEPQIKPQSSDKLDNENKARKSSEDRDELVSETLASIYSDQMLYHKAIASYKKLMLKFPEKSRYFAGKIEQLEKKTN